VAPAQAAAPGGPAAQGRPAPSGRPGDRGHPLPVDLAGEDGESIRRPAHARHPNGAGAVEKRLHEQVGRLDDGEPARPGLDGARTGHPVVVRRRHRPTQHDRPVVGIGEALRLHVEAIAVAPRRARQPSGPGQHGDGRRCVVTPDHHVDIVQRTEVEPLEGADEDPRAAGQRCGDTTGRQRVDRRPRRAEPQLVLDPEAATNPLEAVERRWAAIERHESSVEQRQQPVGLGSERVDRHRLAVLVPQRRGGVFREEADLQQPCLVRIRNAGGDRGPP
jgi:hypothetical protein